MKRILISDVFLRKAFDVISILRKEFPANILLLGIPRISSKWDNLFSYLSYGAIEKVSLRTNVKENFYFDLKVIVEKYKDDEIVYIPVEEKTTDFFINYVTEYGCQNLIYLLPSNWLYQTFRNKESLNKYCLDKGFSAPRMYPLSQIGVSDYPILLKPAIGSGSRGIIRLFSSKDFTDEVQKIIHKEAYLAQELLPDGKEVHGAFFLCDSGRVVGAYTHKRIRTVPEEGGVTVLSQMDNDQKLISQGSQLLEEVGWSGLIMLEYLYDSKTNSYKLIEANPRLWGSIMLSEFGGAYLLTNYVRLCLCVPCKIPVINTDHLIRWFFPMDIIGYIKRFGRIVCFWNFKNTCFINWSYARKDRALSFLFFSIFNTNNFLKLVKRL